MGRVRINRPHVEPYLKSVGPQARPRIRTAIRALVHSGRPKGFDVRILETGEDGARFYRIRIGVHRFVYSVHGPDVYVHRVFHHGDGYGWLERV